MEKVRGLQNLAYQLGLDECKCYTQMWLTALQIFPLKHMLVHLWLETCVGRFGKFDS